MEHNIENRILKLKTDKMKILNNIKIIALAIPFVFASCVDLDTAEFNSGETKTFFKTEDDIKSGIVTIYDALAKGAFSENEGGGLDGSVFDLSKIVFEGKVKTISGIQKEIKAATFCVHSDTENAVEIIKYLSKKFKK